MQEVATHQVFWLGISSETWAIVFATAFGPIAAILITRWRDWAREVRGRRMFVFRTLLATRRQAINSDHVTALNLIEVEFYGVKPVEIAWQNYLRHLNSAPRDRQMTPAEYKLFGDTGNDLLAKLLFAIATFLGFALSEIDIRNGGYAPDGWRYRDERLGIIQEFAKEIALGQRALPVLPTTTSSPGSAQPPQQ